MITSSGEMFMNSNWQDYWSVLAANNLQKRSWREVGTFLELTLPITD